MSTLKLELNKYLNYELYFANFGGIYGDDEVAVMEIRDNSTDEFVASVVKSALEKVSADEQQRDTQLLKEFDLLVNRLDEKDWKLVAMYDDDEWVLTHRIIYGLTHEKYINNEPF